MTTQKYTLNGELLEQEVSVSYTALRSIGLCGQDLPKGLLEINVATGLVKVKLSNSRPAVWMKLGKLLKRNEFTEDIVRTVAEKLHTLHLATKLELKFTTTSEEVIRVYKQGPHSCMKGVDAVGVYATDDVAIAYIEDIEGKVLARSVVCKSVELGLQYTRVYGFSEPLQLLLEKAGYIKGTLEGCKILKIEDGTGIQLPYIDSICAVDIKEDHLLVTRYGETDANTTSGYVRYVECECCGDVIDSEDEEHYSEYREETLCERCFSDQHTYINGEYHHIDSEDIQELEDGKYVLKEDAAYVDYRKEWFLEEDCYYNSYTEEYILKEDIE